MKYIIMADGKGSRWNNYKNIPKHLVEVEGEVLLERTVRLINELDPSSKVIITSHDKRYEFEGSTRYEPKNNILEIDRFTYELIEDNVCFLYGDTYYTEETMEKIINTDTDELLFFGNNKSIVAIKVKDSKVFKENINKVKELFLKNEIKNCKGWQVYQSYQNLEFDKKQIGDRFVIVDKKTMDYNTPEEYENKSIKRMR
jgi:choline kinase